MQELSGRAAVITGAASGIGLGIARALGRRGVRLMLADVDVPALERACDALTSEGIEASGVPTDVSDPAAVQQLAARADEVLGSVHILCNNAGVGGVAGPAWESRLQDWSWLLGINLMGVVHGLQSFVPRMLAHGEEGHIVNTSSILGLTTGGGSIYGVAKHALTRLTEGLHIDLVAQGAKLGVSLLCPGAVATQIAAPERGRAALRPAPEQDPAQLAAREALRERMHRYFSEHGMAPDRVGEIVVEAIQQGRFYVFTHPELLAGVRRRMDAILQGGAPASFRPPADPAASAAPPSGIARAR